MNFLFVRRHRRLLTRLGIDNKPWMIFGSAPDPILPEAAIGKVARIDINSSGRTAKALGLGRADLTLRAARKPWDEHPNLDTRGLLWVRSESQWFADLRLRRKLRGKPHDHVGCGLTMTRKQRDAIVAEASGLELEGFGELGKVSNGVAAACYGLFFGVPEIILTGISLTRLGHSYNDAGRRRMQVEEDRLVLSHLAGGGRVSTTDPELAEQLDMRLWKAED